MLKRLIAKTQIAPNRKTAEIRLEEMKSEPGYVSAYMIGFDISDDYSVVGLYDHGDALAGDYKEVWINIEYTDTFYCFDCGQPLKDIGMGFLQCSCGCTFLPTMDEKEVQSLTRVEQ